MNVAGVDAQTGRFVELGSQSTNQPIFVMICGDSHAAAVSPAIDELCQKYSCRGIQATLPLAVPIIGYTRNDSFGSSKDCPSIGDAFVRFVARNHVRNVILAARWHLYWDTWDSDAFKANLAYKTNLALTIRELLDSGAKVYLLKDVPEPHFDVPRVATVMAMNDRNVDALSFSDAKYEAAERDLRPVFEMAQQLGAVVLDPSRFFLNPENRYRVARNNELLYCDDNHLTVQGARLLLPLFEPIFKTQLR